MCSSPIQSVAYFKNAASILQKSVKSDDAIIQKKALIRIRKFFPNIASLPTTPLKRKHALAVIAQEAGYPSWQQLVASFGNKKTILYSEFFGSPKFNGALNFWFTNYHAAKKHQLKEGGFLLPYKTQFFVAQESFIENTEVPPEDDDWRLIGRDWLEPENLDAHKRLCLKFERKYCR